MEGTLSPRYCCSEGRALHTSSDNSVTSIKLTVGTNGKWHPMGNKAAINRLDDESGSKVV